MFGDGSETTSCPALSLEGLRIGDLARPLPDPGGSHKGAEGSETRRSVNGSMLPHDWSSVSFTMKGDMLGLGGGCYVKRRDENMTA